MDSSEAIAFVMAQEGGYVDDKVDLGGATKFGISLRFLKGLGSSGDIDDDGDIDPEDIVALTRDRAEWFYRMFFWDELGLDRVPPRVAAVVLDTAVNMGYRPAVKLLQQAAKNCGGECAVDGVLGPQTIAAVSTAIEAQLCLTIILLRALKYNDLAIKNPALKRFLPGWLNRVGALYAAISADKDAEEKYYEQPGKKMAAAATAKDV